MLNLNKIVDLALSELSPRQREIIVRRYGLPSGPSMTLADIGDSYGVTRERVRQIEANALAAVHRQFRGDVFDSFTKMVTGHLQKFGGVRRHSALSEELQNSPNQIKFLLEVSGRA